MSIRRHLQQRARGLAWPIVGLTVLAYFTYHLVEGERGLIAWSHVQEQITLAQAALSITGTQRATLERRVGLLRSDGIDRDMLDERARYMLNLTGPNDLVIFLDGPAAPQ